MSDLIRPILDAIEAIVSGAALGQLTPWASVQQGEGVPVNMPCAFIMPRRTQFMNQGEATNRVQVHSVTIRLAILGADPVQLTEDCLAYVQAVDTAIQASFPNDQIWPDSVMQPFVLEHDYGGMFRVGGGVAYWPEIHLAIGAEELQ